MFAFALVILLFSDMDPAAAIEASLARYRRGRAGEVPDEWLAFDDLTPLLREAHEAEFTLNRERPGSLGIRGAVPSAHLLDSKAILADMKHQGLNA